MKFITQTEKYLFVKTNAGYPTGDLLLPNSVGVGLLLSENCF